ncbi:hypothetical protein CALVIDRAFT_543107 [Calocera viscosa TUFC12733]|uniref:Uncharacterized protein n=1 Tax=Calocera viscosa (strain TUFC12733) TaxID=1330018 RepID=A0A167FXZ6_CALVF|nr:hypothetical protein CALVIDRAFT_543107 [Calocera viscosa TUFC12733]
MLCGAHREVALEVLLFRVVGDRRLGQTMVEITSDVACHLTAVPTIALVCLLAMNPCRTGNQLILPFILISSNLCNLYFLSSHAMHDTFHDERP